MLLLEGDGADELNHRYGTRAAVAAMRNAGKAVSRHFGPTDRAVSLGDGRLLVLLPAAREPDRRRVHHKIAEGLLGADAHHPFVPPPRRPSPP